MREKTPKLTKQFIEHIFYNSMIHWNKHYTIPYLFRPLSDLPVMLSYFQADLWWASDLGYRKQIWELQKNKEYG